LIKEINSEIMAQTIKRGHQRRRSEEIVKRASTALDKKKNGGNQTRR
jgi:hypothetical protein